MLQMAQACSGKRGTAQGPLAFAVSPGAIYDRDAMRPLPRLGLAVLFWCVLAAPAAGAPQETPELHVAVVARAVQPGEVVRLHVTCRCGGVPPRVTALGREVQLFPASPGSRGDLWHGLVGIDVETSPGVYPVSVHDVERGVPAHATDLRVRARRFPARRLRVSPQFVDPSPSDLERILRDAAALKTLFAGLTPRRWDGAFAAPVAARATSNFGTRSIFNGQPRSPHAGVDYRARAGTPVVAPAAGRIVMADDLFFTGNTLVVDHGLGLFSLFAHLETMTVKPGDLVDRGAIVGRVGITGRTTGPHLHWGIRLNGARVDPLSLLFATTANPTRAADSRP